MDKSHKVIIIGSGPAGLTAALYCARANLSPLVLAGFTPGGQLMKTTVVENYPGFPDGIEGPELMSRFRKQAEKFGATIIDVDVSAVDFSEKLKMVETEDGKEYQAQAVIVATGAMPRQLDIPGEEEFYGRGVSTCATCDGALFKDKIVAVAGGGDSAMEESLFLSSHAAKVYVIHRRDELRASHIMQEKVKSNPKIETILDTTVEKIVGQEGKVHHLILKNSQKGETTELEVDGLFLAIGHIPVTGYLNGITLDELGYVTSEDGVKTNVEGVFVAGDVEDAKYRQAVTAAGAGCKAALEVQKYLEKK